MSRAASQLESLKEEDDTIRWNDAAGATHAESVEGETTLPSIDIEDQPHKDQKIQEEPTTDFTNASPELLEKENDNILEAENDLCTEVASPTELAAQDALKSESEIGENVGDFEEPIVDVGELLCVEDSKAETLSDDQQDSEAADDADDVGDKHSVEDAPSAETPSFDDDSGHETDIDTPEPEETQHTPVEDGEKDAAEGPVDDYEKRMKILEHRMDHIEQLTAETDILRAKWKRFADDIKSSESFADHETHALIKRRLEEVYLMSKNAVRTDYVLFDLQEQVQKYVLHLTAVPAEEFTKARRKNWTLMDLFRYGGRMAHCFSHACIARKRYMSPLNEGNVLASGKALPQIGHAKSNDAISKEFVKSSIGKELRESLMTWPDYRTDSQMKQIIWYLRSTNAFTNLFPTEMYTLCARHMGYTKFNDDRVISYQDVPPMEFYYVVSGRIDMLRQYKLTVGEVNKSLGIMSKGMTTNPEEMEKLLPRETFLVAKGWVEVIYLHKDIYFDLIKRTVGPPIDFLRTVNMFVDFPCERFLELPDFISTRFYGEGKVVLKDSNNSSWLYVIKTGRVKVVRLQHVIDTSYECGTNHDKYSHAKMMLGLPARQKEFKNSPRLLQMQSNEKRKQSTYHLTIQVTDASRSHSASTVRSRMSKKKSSLYQMIKKRDLTSLRLPPINVPMKHDNGFESVRKSYLTRETTELSTILTGEKQHVEKKKPTYIQLDWLNIGDVFGLDNLRVFQNLDQFNQVEEDDDENENDSKAEPGFALISDGAEVIKISKRFFVQEAENNTLLKIETMYKDYVSDAEVKATLFERFNWNRYKTNLMQQMTNNL